MPLPLALAYTTLGQLPCSNDIIIAWHALPGTTTTLSRSVPLNEHNPVAMELTAAQPTDAHTGRAGIVNDGYWGINLVKGAGYFLSMYIRNPQANAHPVTVAMISADLATTHGEFKLTAVGGGQWARYEGQAVSSASDTDARLAVSHTALAWLKHQCNCLVPPPAGCSTAADLSVCSPVAWCVMQ